MFVNFGSLSRNPISQLVQIGQGLEPASSSQLSFIWVVKEADKSEEVENWLAEFEERMKGRKMFVNERLEVDVLRIGVAVGAKVPTLFVDEMSEKALVNGEEVRKVVEKVMQGGEDRRKRARELAEKARKAMGEGGSSFENLKRIIQFAEGENKHLE
ncbi:hypothetical protein IEQ34_012802 [Dendrobium chrysotoxum]|uniref:Uncharacterized protein n=1 Tax=Dendrobium chrysotoxum TaxID=161865 RepID=A0AAV7GPK6_DENCH|nr:hypothetical protein IEQ34_012802 [Dendrobium chrysotoxum]